MLNIRGAIHTYRYWKQVEEMCVENCRKINSGALLSELRSFRSDIDTILTTIRDMGIAVVENYWLADKCAAARNEIDRLISRYPGCVSIYSSGSDKRMFGVEEVSP